MARGGGAPHAARGGAAPRQEGCARLYCSQEPVERRPHALASSASSDEISTAPDKSNAQENMPDDSDPRLSPCAQPITPFPQPPPPPPTPHACHSLRNLVRDPRGSDGEGRGAQQSPASRRARERLMCLLPCSRLCSLEHARRPRLPRRVAIPVKAGCLLPIHRSQINPLASSSSFPTPTRRLPRHVGAHILKSKAVRKRGSGEALLALGRRMPGSRRARGRSMLAACEAVVAERV
jgi:hypothetical protein